METFLRLFGSLLAFVYHCFDRIVIFGYLPPPGRRLDPAPCRSPRRLNSVNKILRLAGLESIVKRGNPSFPRRGRLCAG